MYGQDTIRAMCSIETCWISHDGKAFYRGYKQFLDGLTMLKEVKRV